MTAPVANNPGVMAQFKTQAVALWETVSTKVSAHAKPLFAKMNQVAATYPKTLAAVAVIAVGAIAYKKSETVRNLCTKAFEAVFGKGEPVDDSGKKPAAAAAKA